MATVTITEWTDPGCPFAFSAEPSRLKLSWTYGDQVEWAPRMVVLHETAETAAEHGLTPEMLYGNGWPQLARKHGMPFDTTMRDHVPGSGQACRAVVAARLHAPEHMPRLLRALRVGNFGGRLMDDPGALAAAAQEAGLDPDELERWTQTDAVAAALAEDEDGARHPTPAGLAQDDKLADWEHGRRYTCPSYVMQGEGSTLDVPGFQPLAVYEVALANLMPQAEQRPAPEDPREVLAWAGYPLATQEVATVMGIERDEARVQLAKAAAETPVGTDGYWSAS